MKGVLIAFMWLIVAVVLGVLIYNGAMCSYNYNRTIGDWWSLGIKASTIQKKIEYIDKFVAGLDEAKLSGEYNSLFFKTPNESFDDNYQALKSLQSRLHEIEKMDVSSFQYQTAIQQITAQEQDEAGAMLTVFQGIWIKKHYPLFWDIWILFTVLGAFALCIGAGFITYHCYEDNW